MSEYPQRSLKIVMAVANNSYPADTRVRNEAQTLTMAGYQVTVIAPQGHAEVRKEYVNGVRVLRYPAPPNGRGVLSYALEFFYVTLATSLLVLWAWFRYGLDVLHVHNPPDTLFIAALIPKLFGKKFVYDHHDLAPELYLSKFGKTGGLIHGLLLGLEKLTCQMANRVIEVNESYLCNDVERNGLKAEIISIVRNAPPRSFTEAIAGDADLRQVAPIIAGYLGNIAQQDGLDQMLKALYHVENDFAYSDWYAVIIGTGDDMQSLLRLAEELGISAKIYFAGYQVEAVWRKLLASTDICFVPDPSNALNDKSTMIKLMDYMALGKAVVAYGLTENRVSGGDAALYAVPNEPLDLARQFMRLVEDPELRERLGQNGRERIQESLAWEYSAKNLLALYGSDFFYSGKEKQSG